MQSHGVESLVLGLSVCCLTECSGLLPCIHQGYMFTFTGYRSTLQAIRLINIILWSMVSRFGFRVKDLGFGIWVQGSGFRVEDLELGDGDSEFGVKDLGYWVMCHWSTIWS